MSQLLFNQRSTAPGAAAATKLFLYGDNATQPRLKSQDPAGLINIFQAAQSNASVAAVSAGYAADTYLAGSSITIPVAGDWRVGAQYRLLFDMTKTAAGVAQIAINLRMGTLGTTADASVLQFLFAAGTAVADTGIFELFANFRTVGGGTSAVVAAICVCDHNLAATGLISTGAAGSGTLTGVSSGFNSTTQTIIGISFNGGASFSGTNTLVQTQLLQP